MSSPGYFRDLQNRLKKFVESGQLGPFRNGYWGHPAYKLPPEANLMAVAHYLEALDFQKEIVKIQTIFGGRNPHPNWLVGGVPSPINLNAAGAVGAINMERLNMVERIIDRTIEFIDNVYIPDLLAIASFYKDWACDRRRPVVEVPDVVRRPAEIGQRLQPRQPDDAARRDHQRQPERRSTTSTSTSSTRCRSSSRTPGTSTATRRRACTRTKARPIPNFDLGASTKGTKTRDRSDRRVRRSTRGSSRRAGRATRWKSGPLARYVIGYAEGHARVQGTGRHGARQARRADHGALLDARPHGGARPRVQLGGARAARPSSTSSLPTSRPATRPPRTWRTSSRAPGPKSAQGVGFVEAPRGALAHWIDIEDTEDQELPVHRADDLEREPA